MRLGLVLAAGAATRFNHKLMLHTPDAKPLVCSAISVAQRYCDVVKVLVRPGPVMTYLKGRVQLVEQRHGEMMDGIRQVFDGDTTVYFGDCWYPRNFNLDLGEATVWHGHDQLDGFANGAWVPRGEPHLYDFLGAVRSCVYPTQNSIVDYLNAIKAVPKFFNGVIDVGVPGQYERLWL